jgi:hypothetical protein
MFVHVSCLHLDLRRYAHSTKLNLSHQHPTNYPTNYPTTFSGTKKHEKTEKRRVVEPVIGTFTGTFKKVPGTF